MEHVADFLSSLRSRGVVIRKHGDKLHYRAAEGALSNELKEAILQHKLEVIDFLERNDDVFSHTLPPPSVPAPLSFQQEWLWNLTPHHRSRKSDVQFAWRLLGPLNVNALSQSISLLIRRHESLRTKLIISADQPMQIVEPYHPINLRVIDIDRPDDQHGAMQQRITEFFLDEQDICKTLFNLELIKLADREHVLCFRIHHIVIDGTSIAIFCDELWSLYNTLSNGRPPPPTQPCTQLSDYAIAQRAKITSWMSAHGSYWDAKLKTARRVEWPNPAGSHSMTSVCWDGLDYHLSSELTKLALRHGLPIPMVVLSLVSVLIWGTCKQNDFVIPTNVSARSTSEHANSVGYYVHALHLHIHISGSEGFSDILESVSKEFNTSYSHLDGGQIATRHPEYLESIAIQWQSLPMNWMMIGLDNGDLAHTSLFMTSASAGASLAITPFNMKLIPGTPAENDTEKQQPHVKRSLGLMFWKTDEGMRYFAFSTAFSTNTLRKISDNLKHISLLVVKDSRARIDKLFPDTFDFVA